LGAAILGLTASLILSGPPAPAQQATAHPLDPLTSQEITTAVSVLRTAGRVADQTRFPTIRLNEPPKAEVLRFTPGAPFRREVFVVAYDRATNSTFEGVVDLRARALLSWKKIEGVQPQMMIEDIVLAQELVRTDPRWREGMGRRGIADLHNVQIDAWPAGHYGEPDSGHRLAVAASYHRAGLKNAYARPIEGLIAYVDLTARRVTRVVDTGVVPVPRGSAEYDARSAGRLRGALRPLQILQPQGPEFEVRGNEVRWQKWRFRFGMDAREGLVLHTVGYEDGGQVRPVLYRASLSEMAVPYGDPGPAWYFRNVFDAGESGMGWLSFPLQPGGDVPQNAAFFNAVFADEAGRPYERPRLVALYERDGGILWKHYDIGSRDNEVRRSRQLVLGYVSTVGNYDYGFNWVFHQDGTLENETLLTGIMTTKAVARRADMEHGEPDHGHMVMPGVVAVHHQHFFNFRLDLDVDGAEGNRVVELNTEALPAGPGNPYGGGFVMKETVLGTEREAQRPMSLAAARKWKVVNPARRSAIGHAAGYALLPGENSVPYAAPDSWIRRRAGFVNAHLWATPYEAAEKYAAGDYVNQSRGGDGLPAWTRANRSLVDRDVVLWYTMGITHTPRPEEWPVMPVHKAGFKLVPMGFFTRNPALDVPP
jgi:primary-amine oxidase